MKRLTNLCFVYFTLVVCFFSVLSASAQVQTARNISIISNSKAYWEYLPEGYDKGNETYPLMLCIHGVGSIGDGSASKLPRALDGLPGNWIRSNSFPKSFTVNGKTFKFIVITPQFTNWPNPDNIDKILDYIIAHYRVDINRIYMTGLSMGGGVTWDYAASAYGKRLAAIVPVCGASNLGLAKSRVITAQNLPVWATHNDGDPTVPAYYTNNNISYINQAPAPNPLARKSIFHADSHDAWYTTYNPKYKEDGLNVYEWMLQYQKGGSLVPPSSNITPTNQPPKANAGGARIITLPTSSLTLLGNGTDADGHIVSYSWSKISGPDAYRIPDISIPNAAIYSMVQGTYTFRLTVTDDKGATAYDDAVVTVKAAPVNQPPVVNAGGARSITLPTSSLTLLGNGTDVDGRIVSYQWSKVSGPASYRLESPTVAQTAVFSLTEGVYLFELQATDNAGAVGKDTVQVAVKAAPNQAPVANAGTDIIITLPVNNITLKGSGTDKDGTIATYSWRKISGPASGAITNTASAQTTVTSLMQGVYLFQLTVTDNGGLSNTDTVQVTVNAAPNKAPIANAGASQTIQLPVNSITASGSGTDNDGTIVSYQWRKISGPAQGIITDAAKAQTTITGLAQGTYLYELKVTDDGGLSATSTMQIIVKAANQAPKANAGTDQEITLPQNSISLSGIATDEDGTIADYQWTKISGPAFGTISNSNQAKATATDLVIGIYQFELKVTDNQGAVARDTVQVIVKAAKVAPSANAGNNITIQLPVNTVTLKGSGVDSDGTIASYQWRKISGPQQGTIVSSTSAQTTVTGLIAGTYQFALTVTDNDGLSSSDMVIITVNVANQSPAVNAGSDITITLPVNTINLSGQATDTDGKIVAYSWTKISGPSAGSFTAPNQATTTMTGLVQGIYEVVFTATDNQNAAGKDTVRITVHAPLPLPNKLPVVSAGANITITLPVNSVNLTGSAKDSDGTITTYQWKKVAGPDTYNIVNPNTAQTQVTGLAKGIYIYELSVRDNDGAMAADTMQVIVKAAPNQAPKANAGGARSITLPTSSLTLLGNGTDVDGRIVSYQWSKVSGPDTYRIPDAAIPNVAIYGLIQGTYTFRLTVTDDKGATAYADAIVTVNPAPNQAPVANAGIDQTIQLPNNIITLNGNGSDADGRIVSYIWTKISGPKAGDMDNATNATTKVKGLIAGIYIYELKVTDNGGLTATDTVRIIVNPAPNKVPKAYAGSNLSITLPVNIITLSGSGSDEDGTIAAYRWTKVSGPAAGTINTPNQAQTTVTNLAAGQYVFELTVTDNQGALGSDSIMVMVNQPANKVPTANAGANQTIQLPVNTVTLTGNGTDSDGTIVRYQWVKINGPAATITTPIQAKTMVSGLVEGIYQFELTVTDNDGASAKSVVNVIVKAANKAPVAHAGKDIAITLPANSVLLNGSATDEDGVISSYQWTKIAGPAQGTITSADNPQTNVTGLMQGIYQFQLKVADNQGGMAMDTVQVVVNPAPNKAPIAKAGAQQTIQLPINFITLSGTGTDTDGTIASYLWKNISGPAKVNMTNVNNAQTMASGLTQGLYIFVLTVTDNGGLSATDTVTVTVKAANQPPVAFTGNDISITLPVNTITLTGSATDADGTIASYQWTKVSGPAAYTIVSAATANTIVNNLVAGIYQFALTVTDNLGATHTATVQVTVNNAPPANQPPVASAGADQSITLPVNSITLNGSAKDADGTILSVLWSKISGPEQYTITNSNQLQTRVTDMVKGIYSIQLKVTDNAGAIAIDTVQISVNRAPNMPPAVSAGNNQTITLPVNSVVLNGSASDKDGLIVTYLWKKISGPDTYTIINDNKLQTAVNNLTEGTYTFELTVTDNDGAIVKDAIQITVLPALNQPPAANAGAAQTIQLPNDKVTLNGSGMDADGKIAAYQWTKVSGPQSYNITNAKAAQATVTNLTAGTYQFVLTVTDNKGATASDTVQITVVAEPVNQLPVAYAGNNITITLPVNNITLKGSGTDKDGTIASYQWTKITGPQAAIAQPAQAETAVTGLVQGVYLFQLQVTDNRGGVAADTMQVTVHPAPNKAPIANAGYDQVITLPVNSVSLTGTATDEDGTIASYQWTKISGPQQGTIVSSTSAQITVTGLIAGTYQFALTVTDNEGLSSTNTMQLIVNEAPNQAPEAYAGKDQTITLPLNTVMLNGSGTDADGKIVSYRWQNVSGQANVSISNPNKSAITVSGLKQGIYQFELTVTDNRETAAKDTVQVTVNEEPLSNIQLSAYPNPVVNDININVQAPVKMAATTRVRVIDMKGNIVYQESYTRGESKDVKKIDVRNLRTGVYFVEVSVGFIKKTLKIVKN